ncbi:TIGR03668 family PPOX class F420-dependent oxidoreductase [Pseudonocardia sp.]|uniref:TIGR03668 family PPOX class F420-dependent oxidoreductase n=1 Tax=Pseudonocardia sp. TaxID=60912 RepID=UPI003D115F3C
MPTLSEDEQRAHVEASPVARLATLRADGTPRLVPFTFVLLDGLLWSAVDDVKPKSGRTLARLADVDRDPRVGVLVDRYDDDWDRLWWVRIDGTAEVRDAADCPAALDALVTKYPRYRDARPPGPVLVVTPVSWAGWTAR